MTHFLFSCIAANVMRFAHKINKIHPSLADKDDSDDSLSQTHVRLRSAFILSFVCVCVHVCVCVCVCLIDAFRET